MDPISALIGGGANLLGSYFSAQTSAQNTQAQIAAQQMMQAQTEQFNAGQAQQQMNFQDQEMKNAQKYNAAMAFQQEGFQQQMSSTAYERAAADMKAAGLNPMMMFGSGGAASTPSGASASVGAPGGAAASVGTPTVPSFQKQPMLGSLGTAVKAAMDTAVQSKTIDKMTDEIALLKAATGKQIAEKATEEARPELIHTQTDVERQHAGAIEQERAIRTPAELEAGGAVNKVGPWMGSVGAVKYLTGAVSDVLTPFLNSALGVGRVGKAFQDLSRGALQKKIDQGNFIGKYGQPIDEYLAN